MVTSIKMLLEMVGKMETTRYWMRELMQLVPMSMTPNTTVFLEM